MHVEGAFCTWHCLGKGTRVHAALEVMLQGSCRHGGTGTKKSAMQSILYGTGRLVVTCLTLAQSPACCLTGGVELPSTVSKLHPRANSYAVECFRVHDHQHLVLEAERDKSHCYLSSKGPATGPFHSRHIPVARPNSTITKDVRR